MQPTIFPYVITEACAGVKDRGCVAVCPVDCIHEGTIERDGKVFDQLFIDPDTCIGCGSCELECPVTAIFREPEVPSDQQHMIQINADFYRQKL